MSHALSFSARLLVPSERGAPGRMTPVGSQCIGRRRAVSRLPTSPGRGSELWGWSRGVGVGSSILGQAFRLERLLGDGWCPKRVLRSERWAEEVNEWVLVLLGRPSGRRPDYPPGTLGPAHELHVVFLGRARAWKPVPEGPRVYEPDSKSAVNFILQS